MTTEYEKLLGESEVNTNHITELTKQRTKLEGLRARRLLTFDPDELAAVETDLTAARANQARIRRLLDIHRADQQAVEQRRRLAAEKDKKAQALQAIGFYKSAMVAAIDAAIAANQAIIAYKLHVAEINRGQALIGGGDYVFSAPNLPLVDMKAAFALLDQRTAALKQLGIEE